MRGFAQVAGWPAPTRSLGSGVLPAALAGARELRVMQSRIATFFGRESGHRRQPSPGRGPLRDPGYPVRRGQRRTGWRDQQPP